jgi:acyl transferase domain-containing protein/3-hydroxymyristoyl/3-hydroxydecanoyl-(acyl carrier protein) dehydratase
MDNRSPIAVVGMAGVFPGAFDTDAFWTNILDKFDATVDVPDHRWIEPAGQVVQSAPAADRAVSRRCCLIEGWHFDPSGFRIAPELLTGLDPLYHLVLHTGREAISGPMPPHINRKRTGVVLAAIALPTEASSAITRDLFTALFEQRLFGRNRFAAPSPIRCAAARVTAFPGALLARALGLGGGSTTLDAACASSLVAVRLACDALHARRLDAVLAGGVSRPDCQFTQIGFSQLRALSPSGRCAPFDHRADGLVVGEGAGILALKRLEDAVADKDRILGLIRGIGMSNDMRGNLLAPDSEGQIRAMRMAYEQTGWSPREVGLIECHGTGATVGDITELQSLRRIWDDGDRKTGRYPIGSVKSMIGHLLTAAGAAGIIKTLQAMAHRVIPPSLNFEHAPASSPLHGSPFRVQTEAEEWQVSGDKPRKAAVSAFGFGGINAHLLLEQWRPPASGITGAAGRQSARSHPAPDPANPVDPVVEVSDSEKPIPVAIVGMGAAFGPLGSLEQFSQAIFDAKPAIRRRSTHRWKGCDDVAGRQPGLRELDGAYVDEIRVDIADFHIPPREIPDILPQQLLMLQTAAAAMADAQMAPREDRPQMGVVIGIDFDFEATNFHFRWSLPGLAAQWNRAHGLNLDPADLQQWLQQLQEIAGPPLNAARTLGALGSMVASRVAREFRLGGPGYTVSAEEASGLKALEIGIRAIRNREAPAFLIGAVDLFGELRRLLTAGGSHRPTPVGVADTFADKAADMFPGDGAAALVLKPLDQAIADGNRVYAVVTGFGHSGEAEEQPDAQAMDSCACALQQALAESAVGPADIEYVETPVSVLPADGPVTQRALENVFQQFGQPTVLGNIRSLIGCAGAAAGLAAAVKAALCLHHRILPPVPEAAQPPQQHRCRSLFSFPRTQHRWEQCRTSHQRRACVVAPTASGEAVAAVLESVQGTAPARLSEAAATFPQKALQPKGDELQPTRSVRVSVGGPALAPALPAVAAPSKNRRVVEPPPTDAGAAGKTPKEASGPLKNGITSTAHAHQAFLAFSEQLTRSYAQTFELQTRLLEEMLGHRTDGQAPPPRTAPCRSAEPRFPDTGVRPYRSPLFNRQQCLEFAVGKASNVFGPDWAEVDSYPARVRLPDEPLMLVDRIVAIEGRPLSLTSGRIVTEHDVRADAWYLDAGRAPVCIAVEAGQADLFLCSYLGVDAKVKGQRVYRLLDASVVFHRQLPAPGETIRYEIHIDKFIRQGETILFFFRFEGSIAGKPLISMTNGCAGFFTEEEIRRSGGILPGEQPPVPLSAAKGEKEESPVPLALESYADSQIDALRKGELAKAFGPAFEGVTPGASLRLPGGRMKLIDRILRFDPHGGRFGLGEISAEVDIHPNDWFLTCHFVDDMTMPGTLMYECCAHTLRVFLQRIGWVTSREDVHYEPVLGVKSVLKCRGPVTPNTKKVLYRVEIKEIGYRPEPYAIADAHMLADGRYIVHFTDMTLQMTGISRKQLASFWHQRRRQPPLEAQSVSRQVLFDQEQIREFATGKPSRAFGAAYRRFDEGRFVARLPAPPYSFIDRIVKAEPPAGVLEPGGWVEAETDVSPDDWYFRAERSGVMPYSVVMETALQSCGWLAAWCGSALQSDQDLRFRNLDGRTVQYQEVGPDAGTLSTRCRLLKVSRAAGIIIEAFEFQVLRNRQPVFEGTTSFGFFTRQALSGQTGIPFEDDRDARTWRFETADTVSTAVLEDLPPFTPDDVGGEMTAGLCLPARAIRMIDRIDRCVPSGGPHGLGAVLGSKSVDPKEWFFRAHFFQDPVCPGSLGVESFLQLLKFAALQRFKPLADTHRFGQLLHAPQVWKYRGQILPTNRRITVEAFITEVREKPLPQIRADGRLSVDGLCIYSMHDFGVTLVPCKRQTHGK